QNVAGRDPEATRAERPRRRVSRPTPSVDIAKPLIRRRSKPANAVGASSRGWPLLHGLPREQVAVDRPGGGGGKRRMRSCIGWSSRRRRVSRGSACVGGRRRGGGTRGPRPRGIEAVWSGICQGPRTRATRRCLVPDDSLHDTAQFYGRPTCGWHSDLPTFTVSAPRAICLRLEEFVSDAGPEQVRAWSRSIPWLQRECREVIRRENTARGWDAILEYELPREARRPDLIVLESGVVVVLELKGRKAPSQADLDQVFAYARDLRAYHADCA